MIRDAIPSYNNFYEATAQRDSYPSLQGEIVADVCIIGGGIAGCSSALHLSLKGYRVVLLESELIGHGASGRSGGQLLPGYSCGQAVLQQQLGNDGARTLWDMSVEAVQLAIELIKQHQIECDLKFGHLDAAIKPRHRDGLLKHQEQLSRDYNYQSLKMIEGDELHSLVNSSRYISGLYDSACAHIHPLNYTLGLARAATLANASIHENSKVIGVDQSNDSVRIRTEHGVVNTKYAVLCANIDNVELSKSSSRIMPVATYMIATEPLDQSTSTNFQPPTIINNSTTRPLPPRGGETERGGSVITEQNSPPSPLPLSHQGRGDKDALDSITYGKKVSASFPSSERERRVMNPDIAVSDCNFILDYFRMSQSRLLFGGGVSYSGHANSFSMSHIQQRMLKVFPQLHDVKIEYAWHGLLDISMNRAPNFGRINNNIYYLQGFSGHGLALATMVGKLVAESIAMQSERFDLFTRIHHRSFPGGILRTPLLMLAMLWYRLRDMI